MKVLLNNRRKRYMRAMIAAVILVITAVIFLYLYNAAFAATRTWDGGGTSNDWSDCDNWSDNTCPTSSDIVVFDNTSDKDSIVDASFGGTIQEFQQNAGYDGTTTFSGATSTTITTTSSTTFTHININKTGTSTLLAGNDLTATNLLLSSGTLDATAIGCSGASCDITLSGNWTNAGATFTPRSGTVALNGSGQSMTGTTTFYDLTKTTTSTDTLYFGAGQEQTVTNEWTAQGAESNVLSLRSTVEDTQWKIDPQNTRTLNYLNVKDSNNTNATVITTYPFSIADGTNNTNWDFSVPPPPEVRIQSGTRFLPGVRLQ